MRGVRPAPGPLIEPAWSSGSPARRSSRSGSVFRDPAFDYRLVIVGAVAPGRDRRRLRRVRLWPTRCSAASCCSASSWSATIGRRSLRRHLIALPIGTFLHLVFDGAFTRTQSFWWPLAGGSWPRSDCPWSSGAAWNLLLELVGLGILVWAWQRFGLRDPARRRRFLRTGPARPDARGLNRSPVAGPGAGCAQLRGCCSSSAMAGLTSMRRGLLQGRMDVPLDEVGMEQAAEVAKALATPDRVISSPLLRARATAEALRPAGRDRRALDRARLRRAGRAARGVGGPRCVEGVAG